jgi:hypothetical protein
MMNWQPFDPENPPPDDTPVLLMLKDKEVFDYPFVVASVTRYGDGDDVWAVNGDGYYFRDGDIEYWSLIPPTPESKT